MGLEQACSAAGGGGEGVWSQISMGRFGCWVSSVGFTVGFCPMFL